VTPGGFAVLSAAGSACGTCADDAAKNSGRLGHPGRDPSRRAALHPALQLLRIEVRQYLQDFRVRMKDLLVIAGIAFGAAQ
jgi:hypothetical protein